MSAITEAAADLAAATRGVDWDDVAAGDAVRRLHAAPPDDPQLGDAFAVLLDRLRDARPQDSDGVAHVAISAGTLVERGAPAALLAEALLPLLPEVLQLARGYADRCLAALGDEPTTRSSTPSSRAPTSRWAIPLDWCVWNEGAPRDVVAAGRPRTLVVGPPATMRTWNCQRTFGALGAEVRVTAELTPAEVRAATAEAEPFADPPP